jgi:eukaryotic translation initiation factor 2C
MLVGCDVSHPEKGNDVESIAAVVASMDRSFTQYACYITSQSSRKEMITELEDAMYNLLVAFQKRNGQLPKIMVVYRDGVSEGQFDQTVRLEVPAIRGALHRLGCLDDVKISWVVATKGHHTRLCFQEEGGELVNLCPGVCVDSSNNESITSARYNDFFLNSHTAIQGTNKPCKYTLVYDEIGLKMNELELLTYWTCYLYSRCNRSVSYAVPAYYAHWASKRGSYLFSGGCNKDELNKICDMYNTQNNGEKTMFFI